ncbi:MAG TPA: glycosyl hydrolase [Myxococcaceae bacterium]|nr:glycosyl hydrolase [Myxococcaceae bacterium]
MATTRKGRGLGWACLCVLGLAVACGEGRGAGAVDAGPRDSGAPDGLPPADGGPSLDAGTDAGLPSDGGSPADGGGGTGRRIDVPPAGRLYHGVFPAGSTLPDSDISMQAADAYRDAVGRPLAYVYLSNEWYQTKAFPRVTAEGIRARGAVPFIRLHLRSQQRQLVTDPLYTLDNIIAGQFDADLRAWADGAKAFGAPLVVQYGTEVNGDWNPWSAPYNGGLDAGPEKFRKAYRHIVEVMRAAGATNITWALHINGENWPGDDPRNNAGAYYPGDDVVDWIGFSLYQNYGAGDPRCRDISQLLADREAELGAAATSKPLFVFELGTSAGSTQCDPGGWVRQTLQDLLGGRWPELHGFAWWDETTADRSIVMAVPGEPALQQPFHDVLNGPLAPNLEDRPIVR